MQDTFDTLTTTRASTTNILDGRAQSTQPLRASVETALHNYFAQLGEATPNNLYELVLAEVEAPLLEVVLRQTRGNQTKAAQMLGLSRGTLRKKLKQYNLD